MQYYHDHGDSAYSVFGMIAGAPGGTETLLTIQERFELVSSLYGPGNLICWFFLFLSVLASWTLHPSNARRDTITNDFLAVLAMPVVAVAHFFYQLYSHEPNKRSGLFTSLDRDDIRSVAAIEAPLTVCEDSIACAGALYCVTAWKGHEKRMALVLGTGAMCVAAEMWLWGYDLEYGSMKSMLVLPYLFQSKMILDLLMAWYGLMIGIYLVEMAWGILPIGVRAVTRGREVEEGWTVTASGAAEAVRRVLWPGRVTSWMSAATGVMVSGCSVWIRYGAMYPAGCRFHSFRFIPKGVAGMGDLDQVVAMLGGLTTLTFTGWDVYKSRRAGRR